MSRSRSRQREEGGGGSQWPRGCSGRRQSVWPETREEDGGHSVLGATTRIALRATCGQCDICRVFPPTFPRQGRTMEEKDD